MSTTDEVKSAPALDLLPQNPRDLSAESLAILNVLNVVQHPDQVRVSITRAKQSVMIEFEVADDDKGKVIGKNGHTISAIRSIVGAASGGSEVSYLIHLLEDDRPDNGRPRRSYPPRRRRY